MTVLGCSGTYAAADVPCTGYLVEGGGVRVLLDAGPGVLATLQRYLRLDDLDAVVLTHEHPDHWLELPVLRNAYKYALDRAGVAAYGTAGTHALADILCHGELEPTFRWTTVDEHSVIHTGDLRWTFSRTDHPVETLAVRVDCEGASFVFSSDTGPAWSPSTLGPEIDVFLCEASFDESLADAGPHLTAGQAGHLAREAGVGRLLLTHLMPGTDADEHRRRAEDAFGRPVDLVSVGDRFEL